MASDMISGLNESGLLWVALALSVILVSYLSLSKRQKDAILSRLQFQGHPISAGNTPPRSFSPEKQLSEASSKVSEYATIFPPSQRDVLKSLSLSDSQREALGDPSFDENNFINNIIGWEEDFRACHESKYLPSGFSVKEVKALGDFPDYAELSGVPLPSAYEEFDLDKALPRPYRPFRWPYHQTMSLTKLEVDWWLELENTYKLRMAQRKQLYAEHGESVLTWLPGSELACKEVMEMALQFLCARYPQHFLLHEDNKTFENKILGTKQEVTKKHPLLVLLDNVPEDFAIMIRNPETGYYHFRCGMICSALGWNTGTKIGMRLHEIHEPIPDYKEKMKFSMDRFFTKMRSDKPIQRGSWGFEVDQPLFMLPGDPHEKYRDVQSPDLTLGRIHQRVDWQTLRRLPLSGAIVFNFKALFTPIEEFRDEPYIPSLILKVLNEGNQSIIKYKNTWHVEHVVKPALEDFKKEQIEKGIIPKDWEVETLAESPFFPGWEEKWHRQQGF